MNPKNEFKKPVDNVFEIKISDFRRGKRNKFLPSDHTNFHECEICFKIFPSELWEDIKGLILMDFLKTNLLLVLLILLLETRSLLVSD